jgi:hypothetical protein
VSDEVRLFDPGPAAPAPMPLSDGVKRTMRQQAELARGVHPATKLPLRAEGGSCGTCAHLRRFDHGATVDRSSRGYFKCSLRPMTGGPGTDIRVSWPACTRWEPEA